MKISKKVIRLFFLKVDSCLLMLIRKETTLQICYLLIPKYIQFNYHKMTKVRSLKRNVLFHNAMCSRFIDLRRVIHINYTFFHHLNPAKWNLDLFEPIVISYIFQFYYSCESQTFCNRYFPFDYFLRTFFLQLCLVNLIFITLLFLHALFLLPMFYFRYLAEDDHF